LQPHPFVELENIGNGRRQVEPDDLLVGEPFEVLDDTPQAVSVGYHQQFVLPLESRENHALPVG
jgi:hypothetical protein